MKKPRSKEKILGAAFRLFSAKGYLGTTTREIAREAGVAELTVFRNFSSKENLFEEMIRNHSFLPALKGLLTEVRGLEYRAALTRIAEEFLDRLMERRDLIKIMHSEMQTYPATVKQIYHRFIDEMFRTLASYFRELQEKGSLRSFPAEIAARAFLGMFFSYFNSQVLISQKRPGKKERDRIIGEFVGIFTEGTVR